MANHISTRTCEEAGCHERHYALGKCVRHYQRQRFKVKTGCAICGERRLDAKTPLCRDHHLFAFELFLIAVLDFSQDTGQRPSFLPGSPWHIQTWINNWAEQQQQATA